MSAKVTTAYPTGRKKLAQGEDAAPAAGASQGLDSRDIASLGAGKEGVIVGGNRKLRNLWPLPSSWKWTTVGELSEVIRGASPRPKGDPRYFGGEIPWIMIADVTRQPGKYLYKTREGVTKAGSELSRLIPAGELILSNSGTVCVPKILKVDGCIHDGFVAFPALKDNVDLNFAYYWFEFVRPQMIHENRQGITQVNLNTGIVREMHFPFAPKNEQRRIVAEIEKQFTRLDAGVAALRRVQANLKRYRAAVLKAACEGKLVPTEAELQKSAGKGQNDFETGEQLLQRILAERRQQWSGRGKYKEPAAPDTAKLSPLPEGWTWTTLDQLHIYLRNGWGLKPDAETGIPILRISANRPMFVNLGDVRYLSGSANDYAEFFVMEGDLLFTRYNGNPALTGVCGVIPPLDAKIVHPDKLIRVRVVPKLCLAKFVGMMANVGTSRDFLASRARTTAGQTGISGSDLRGIPIPLPPLAEQTRIVAEVERRFSVVEELESVVSANIRRGARLRQSILQKAFTGELIGELSQGN